MAVMSGWYGSYGSLRPKKLVRHLAFGDMGHAKCAMGPKQSLVGVLFGLKSGAPMSEGGSAARSWPPVSPQVTVSSRWNGSYGSMGSGGHVRHLDLVMGAMTSP